VAVLRVEVMVHGGLLLDVMALQWGLRLLVLIGIGDGETARQKYGLHEQKVDGLKESTERT
jgi:hypothetical protein